MFGGFEFLERIVRNRVDARQSLGRLWFWLFVMGYWYWSQLDFSGDYE